MRFTHFSTLAVFLCTGAVVSGAALGGLKAPSEPSLIRHSSLTSRGEPGTGDDDFPDTTSHPNNLDKVETAFRDAIQLTSYVLRNIATDTDIFPHYFNEEDRDEITRIFQVINNGDKGADRLTDIHVQTTDSNAGCSGRTLAYLKNGEKSAKDKPYLVLCPTAFRKKAVSELKGAPYGSAKFGPIVDYNDANGPQGYGPVNVYDKLDKKLARTNADSYAYYASQVLWTTLCQYDFEAPRAGTDDVDPDFKVQVFDEEL
ncbi:hypothetical protein Hte_001238 [Hypoxylon texense]